MNITNIINEIKAKCPTFESRVAGAAEYEGLRSASNLLVPAAYVVPMDESASANATENSIMQTLTERFMVVVVISNQADPRGQKAYNQLHELRAELWRGILGWIPETDYEPIEFSGGSILNMDRFRLDYGYEFTSEFTIDDSDTRIADDVAALPAFESVTIQLDHKTLPPDGVVDHEIEISLPQ